MIFKKIAIGVFIASILSVGMATFVPTAFAAMTEETTPGHNVGQPAPAPTTPSATPSGPNAFEKCRDNSPDLVSFYKCSGGVIVGKALGVTWDLIVMILAWVFYTLFLLSGLILWLAGTLLDAVMYYVVLNMGLFINNKGASGIQIAWGIIRDLGNLALIAGFITVGIGTILQVAQYSADKYLARLIIAALLINFSYFFTGAMIDAANFVTVQVYHSSVMTKGCAIESASFGGFNGAVGDAVDTKLCSISESFMQSVHLGTFDDIKKLAENTSGNSGNYNLAFLFISILGIILFLLTAYVFFATAVLLIARFVVLVLLLVTSPIGIAGGSMPFVDEYSSRWWSAFTGQVLFAPAYIILVAISLTIIRDFIKVIGTDSSGLSFASVASTNVSLDLKTISLLLSFIVSLAFMYAALAVARSMSSQASEFSGIYDFTKRAASWSYGLPSNVLQGAVDAAAIRSPAALRVPLGFVSAGLRSIQGAKLNGAPSYNEEKEATLKSLANGPFIKTQLELAQQSKNLKESGELSRLMAIPADKRSAKENADLQKAIQGLGTDQLKALISSGPGGILGVDTKKLESIKKYLSPKQLEELVHGEKTPQATKDAMFKALFGKLDGLLTGEQTPAALEEIEKTLEKMSETEAKLYLNERREYLRDERVAGKLSKDQYAAVRDDPNRTSDEKKAMRDIRVKTLKDDLASGNADRIEKAVKNRADDEIERMPIDVITNAQVIRHLKPAAVRKRYVVGTNTEREQIVKAHTENGGKATDLVGLEPA